MNGSQVIPTSWIDAPVRSPGTILQHRQRLWMVDRSDGVLRLGSGGQYIFVTPDVDLMVVMASSVHAGEDRRGQHHGVYDVVEQFIVRRVRIGE